MSPCSVFSLITAAVLAPVTGSGAVCEPEFELQGYGKVALVPTGWKSDGDFVPVAVEHGKVVPYMDGRAYFADECTAGTYDRRQYLALNLLGKTLRYTTDLRGAGCGCNAAFYLTSMRQNPRVSECFDYYCDANNVCGESCAEIDIQEANQYAWHSTLHTATDHSGVGGGYGGGDSWNGPRDFGAQEYGPGAECVDTTKAFDVAVSFPVDAQGNVAAMEVTLSQDGKSCPLTVRLDSYDGMNELSDALEAGMTPIISYWSADDMLWMDGKGSDGQGPCGSDHADACTGSVTFSNFSVSEIGHPARAGASSSSSSSASKAKRSTEERTDTDAVNDRSRDEIDTTTEKNQFGSASDVSDHVASGATSHCAKTQKEDCRSSSCCRAPGMQCYEKNEWWGACKESCQPGSLDPQDKGSDQTPWTCTRFGQRAPGTPNRSKTEAAEVSSSASSASDEEEVYVTSSSIVVKLNLEKELPELPEGEEVVLRIDGEVLHAQVVSSTELDS